MDIGLVALVVELLAEEKQELLCEFFFTDHLHHSWQVHRCSPAVLPAGTLIETVTAHLCVGLVDMLELAWPDAVEDFFTPLCPS